MAPPVLVFGEVHTALLQHSVPLSLSLCEQVLRRPGGERVRSYERPIAHAVSPPTLVGVDCGLTADARARVVGTVATRASITGGHVAQASTAVRLARGATSHRAPWSYYLARPGQVELVGRADLAALAPALVRPRTAPALDIEAITNRTIDAVQSAPRLDRDPPLRIARTRLKWAAALSGEDRPSIVHFEVHDAVRRGVRLAAGPDQIDTVVSFCEDLALHDWLLTTLLRALERSRIGAGDPAGVVRSLRPVIDHLLHLWMPAARGDAAVATLWASLDRRPGLGRQWLACVQRIRDQLALATIGLLEATARGGGPA